MPSSLLFRIFFMMLINFNNYLIPHNCFASDQEEEDYRPFKLARLSYNQQPTEQFDFFAQLQPELTFQILSYLPRREQIYMRSCCHLMVRLIDHEIWKKQSVSVNIDDDLELIYPLLQSLPFAFINFRFQNLTVQDAKILSTFTNHYGLSIAGSENKPTYISFLIPHLTALKSLTCEYNNLASEECRYIKGLSNLTTLNIANNMLGPEGAKEIAFLQNLTFLNISYNAIRLVGAKHISKLHCLTFLDISGNDLAVEDALSITSLVNLQHLKISNNNLQAKGTMSILNHLSSLETLDVKYNNITMLEEHLEKERVFSRLSTLKIGYNSVNNNTLIRISQSFINLTSLNLQNNKLKVQATSISAPNFIHLKKLNIKNNTFLTQDQAALALLKENPNLRVVY